jgi:ribonuclease HI
LNEKISIFTDSQYVKNGITSWIFNWKKNNWKTANGASVKNQDLWEKLHNLNFNIKPEWNWVKGHSDNLYNNVVDFVATSVARNQRLFSLKNDHVLLLEKFSEMSKFLIIE